MITTAFGGRFGNQMFQYVAARLVAEKTGLGLCSELAQGDMITPTKHKNGEEYEGIASVIVETLTSPSLLEMRYENRPYHLQGYWQESQYYLPNREQVLGFFEEKAPVETNKDDIIMHIRLGDYKTFGRGGTVLDPQYYMDCLNHERKKGFDKVYIVTDAPNDEYFRAFKEYNIVYTNGTPKSDFWFLTKFDRIICGNSSFSWWASFLSNASVIYTPECWMRHIYGIRNDLQNIQNNIQVVASFMNY